MVPIARNEARHSGGCLVAVSVGTCMRDSWPKQPRIAHRRLVRQSRDPRDPRSNQPGRAERKSTATHGSALRKRPATSRFHPPRTVAMPKRHRTTRRGSLGVDVSTPRATRVAYMHRTDHSVRGRRSHRSGDACGRLRDRIVTPRGRWVYLCRNTDPPRRPSGRRDHVSAVTQQPARSSTDDRDSDGWCDMAAA
jgi:hypothetical protein